MNVLSLFSGIGGLDLGLERAGMTVVGQVEIDPWCRKVLAKHWPEVPRHDDIRTAADWWDGPMADAEGERCGAPRAGRPAGDGADGEGLAPRQMAGATGGRPAVDLVAGGFPCQPVSLAGKGLAQADSRWLWPAFAGIVRQLRPRYVLVENVPGLLGRGMGDVLADLAAIGYDAEWDCVPAAFVGAPHIRNRVWIVAHPAGIGRLGADHDQREHATPRRAGWSAADDLRVFGEAGSEPRILADAQREPVRAGAGGVPAAAGAGEGEGPQRQRVRADPRHGSPTHAHADREPLGWPAEPRCERGHWATEPGVGRVAHGIPARVDRLRGLGNAVVPQVAEHIGRLILAGAA